MVIIIIILAVVCSFLLDTVVCSSFFLVIIFFFRQWMACGPIHLVATPFKRKGLSSESIQHFLVVHTFLLLLHSSTLLMIRITFFVMFSFWKKTSFVLFKVPIMNKIESLVIVVVLRHHDSTHNDRCFLHNGTFSM